MRLTLIYVCMFVCTFVYVYAYVYAYVYVYVYVYVHVCMFMSRQAKSPTRYSQLFPPDHDPPTPPDWACQERTQQPPEPPMFACHGFGSPGADENGSGVAAM